MSKKEFIVTYVYKKDKKRIILDHQLSDLKNQKAKSKQKPKLEKKNEWY